MKADHVNVMCKCHTHIAVPHDPSLHSNVITYISTNKLVLANLAM